MVKANSAPTNSVYKEGGGYASRAKCHLVKHRGRVFLYQSVWPTSRKGEISLKGQERETCQRPRERLTSNALDQKQCLIRP